MTKDEMIIGSLWQVTIYAAFQRAKVYSDKATEKDKKKVKQHLFTLINAKIPSYKKKVGDKKHIDNINSISSSINSKWATSLHKKKIPIGVVQKAFNLYLKLMWSLDKIEIPPHCPVDKVIIDMLKKEHRTSWTKIRDIKKYESIISQLKLLAKKEGISLAEWELSVYKKP